MNDLCAPVPDAGFVYSFNGVGLDVPDMTTGPIAQNGIVSAGTTFILFWNAPSLMTQNALGMTNGGSMTFLAADGSQVSAQVAISSSMNGGSLVTSVTVLSPTPG